MSRALVILSGGQDSTTCLYWAKQHFTEVSSLTFNYGQRHKAELEAARRIASMANVSHELVELGPVLVGSSPLVDLDAAVGRYANVAALPGGIEPTFVPGRNALFLVLAANRAAAQGAQELVMGVCEADFGGYPDCRREFIDAMEQALSLGFTGYAHQINVHTPLMRLSKSESVKLAAALPGCMEALSYSHTCYQGIYPPDPQDHACLLRARGFHEAGLPDPLIVRAMREGLLPQEYPDDGMLEPGA